MKRSSRLHNRAPSTYSFRKPYEFAAISIRWQKTFSYIENVRNYSTSKTITTPNFGTIPMPEVGNPDAHHQELSNVKIESVNDVSVSALRGPWLIIFPGSVGNSVEKHLPSGELMIDGNGVVFFRPGKDLGHGVGHIELSGNGKFTMTLETYFYEQKSKFPPNASDKFLLNGVVQRAIVGSHGTSIFTINGRALSTAEPSSSFEFQAAKMDGWSEEAHKASAFQPDLTLAQNLERIIPPMALFPPRPKVDLEKHKVGDVPNIYYIPNWVSSEEEETMLKILKATPKEAKQQLDRRLVQEYGGVMCTTCNTSFVSEANIPTWCTQVNNGLLQAGIFTPATFPNNVRIHEYEANEGIGPHVDGPIYVPVVAILSLASTCVMSFYPRREPYENPMDHYNDTFKFDGDIANQKPMCSVVLEPRSLLVFSHDIYWYHPHGIRAESADSLKEAETGPIVNSHQLEKLLPKSNSLPRKYRVGVTIRHLLPRCNHQPTRTEYFMNEAYMGLHNIPKVVPQTDNTRSIGEKPVMAEPRVPIAPEPPQRHNNLPIIRGDTQNQKFEEKSRYPENFSTCKNLPSHHSEYSDNQGKLGQTPLQSSQSAQHVGIVHPQPYPGGTMGISQPQQPFMLQQAASPWQCHLPGHPCYVPCYMPIIPMYPVSMGSPCPSQSTMSSPTSTTPPSPSLSSSTPVDNLLSSKLSDILTKIHSVEKNVSRLENTVDSMKSNDSAHHHASTSQVLQGLIQSHMRLKEDHGEILDRVCKAVVETNHMVKNLPKNDSGKK